MINVRNEVEAILERNMNQRENELFTKLARQGYANSYDIIAKLKELWG